MIKRVLIAISVVFLFSFILVNPSYENQSTMNSNDTIQLPEPATDGNVSVEEALNKRRSVRSYQDKALSLKQVSQMLWSAYGITKPLETPPFVRGGFKTAPSAGALYPLDVYLVAGNVDGLKAGVYKYIPKGNILVKKQDTDKRVELWKSAYEQNMVKEAPITIVYSAIFERTTKKYGERGKKYIYVDLGHSAQNVYLQAEALGLSSCAIGAFKDEKVSKVMNFGDDEIPLYMMPVGYKK